MVTGCTDCFIDMCGFWEGQPASTGAGDTEIYECKEGVRSSSPEESECGAVGRVLSSKSVPLGKVLPIESVPLGKVLPSKSAPLWKSVLQRERVLPWEKNAPLGRSVLSSKSIPGKNAPLGKVLPRKSVPRKSTPQ